MTHLAKAIEEACRKENTSPSRKFIKLKLNPSSASKLLKTRPSVSTLRLLCAEGSWTDSKASLSILLAHLKDEVERSARLADELTLKIPHTQNVDVHLESAILAIDALAKQKNSFRELLIEISQIIKKSEKIK